MYVLKEQFVDFVVDELMQKDLLCDMASNFHVYLLKKTNYTSERAVQQIARSLGIPRKRISYAGTKDKHAITSQYICIQGASKERVLKLELKDISLKFIGYMKQPLRLGHLKGNTFSITVRNLDAKTQQNSFPEQFKVPNYFDEQRFSTNNLQVGLHMLAREFDLAVAKILQYDEDYKPLLQNYLAQHKKDFVGALRKLPKRSLLFYIHSVQSYFFNELLRQKIETTNKDFVSVKYSEGVFAFPKKIIVGESQETLPLPGYLSKNDLVVSLLKQYKLEASDFLIRQLPELSASGDERLAFMSVSDFKSDSLEDDDCYEGKKKIKLSFTLQKGSYATIVIRQVIAAMTGYHQ